MNIMTLLQKTEPTIWLQVVLILGMTAVLGLVVRRILNKLRQTKSTPEWARTLCDSFYFPSAWLIWGYGVLLTLEVTVDVADILISQEILAKSRNIFLILFATWILLSWKAKYEKVLQKRVKKDPSKTQDEVVIIAVGKVVSIVIVIVASLIVLDTLDVQLTALLAVGGIGGVAIGFAGKDVVANFFGGLMVHINRPFSIGERIMSPNKHFEGIVEEIGWYMTRIRTLERRPMYIPNALFIDAIIENPGRMYNRRIKQTIGVRYEDVRKIETIVEAIRSMLRNHEDIDQDKLLFVHFLAFGPYSLDLEIYCFTKTIDWERWRDIQQGVFLTIVDIIASHGAEIAFPTNTVHLPDVSLPLQKNS